MKQKIILIGGGGHCKSVIDVIEVEAKYSIAGIIDMPEKIGQKILNYQVIASDKDLPEIAKEFKNILITVGHIESPETRIKIYELLKGLKIIMPVIISPFAYVSKQSIIGEGSVIMHQALINASVAIGTNCIINNKALIEHDSEIGNNCHISTNATINGGVIIGENCFIGSHAVTKQYIEIAPNTIIGAGTVVTKSITESGLYVGNPARRIK